MKLRNKKTGEIVYATMMASYGGGELQIRYYPVNNAESTHFKEYRSISELNEEWEDYEEPKTHWMIDTSVLEPVREIAGMPYEIDKEIGNWFSTKEEAEKAVEKLKAWKRLKDKGFRIDNWDLDADNEDVNVLLRSDKYKGNQVYALEEDLDLLFGGVE